MDVKSLITLLEKMPPRSEIQVGEGIEIADVYYDESLGTTVLVEA